MVKSYLGSRIYFSIIMEFILQLVALITMLKCSKCRNATQTTWKAGIVLDMRPANESYWLHT